MLAQRSFSVLLVLALAAFGCESKKTDGAAPTPAGNAPAEATPASTPGSTTEAKKSYSSPEKFDLVPLAVGQWIRMLVKTPGQPPAQTYIRIVGKEGDAFWYEIESNTPNGTTVLQFLIEESARLNFSKGAVKKMKMKVGLAPIQELSGPAMVAVSAITDNYVSLISKPDVDKAERADANVNAGEFKGCYVHEIEQNVLGTIMKVKSWNHPAVPINGFVRSEGTADGANTTTELWEMHMEGAKSVLQ
jgi:hypothetical protein